jgi:hypothetical protein
VVKPLTQITGAVDVAAYVSLNDAGTTKHTETKHNETGRKLELRKILEALGARDVRLETTRDLGVGPMRPVVHTMREACPFMATSWRCDSEKAAISSFRLLYAAERAFQVLLQLLRERGETAATAVDSVSTHYDWVLRARIDTLWLASVPWAKLTASARTVYLARSATTPSRGVAGQPWSGLDGVGLIPGEFGRIATNTIHDFVTRCRAGNVNEAYWIKACVPESFLWRTTLLAQRVPFQLRLFPQVPKRPSFADQGNKWGRWMCILLTAQRLLNYTQCEDRLAAAELWEENAVS